MNNALRKYVGRLLSFTAFPSVGLLLALAAWPLIYPVLYFFFPFLGYGEIRSAIFGTRGTPTIFAGQYYGWHFSIAYLALLAALAVWSTRKLSLSKALLSFVFFFGIGAMLVHGVMFAFGYH